ncbi:adenylate/guanylate cyclase domain-containing protein [Mycolicibacterium palauense]|uniref:adenylate/guanylate cyclase domain-containing protein n=1 Tax=Mycolicibacterium palauense TaxID=2034511 RepID=UPI000BFEFE9E|nr:adenylate/guanylate cyclase domain-containing protein [Mycolicibacterium palauense]
MTAGAGPAADAHADVDESPDTGGTGSSALPGKRRRGRRRPRALMGRVSIQSKILIMLLFTSVLSAAIVGAIGFQSGRNGLRSAVFDQLTELREAQTRRLEALYVEMTNSLVVYSGVETTTSAMTAFRAGFAELSDATITPEQQQRLTDFYATQFAPEVEKESGQRLDLAAVLPASNAQRYLQAIYTAPYTTDTSALNVDDPGDGSAWSAANARYTKFFREIVRRFGFRDALLIDPQGTVVYSAYKQEELGTNLLTGPYATATFTDAFNKTVNGRALEKVEVTDFTNYLPNYNEPTAWLMSPVGTASQTDGVLALEFPIEKINNLMTYSQDWRAVGMGSTGETYLAGPDNLMRSDSRLFLEDPQKYKQEVVAAGTPPDVAESAIRLHGTTLVQPVGNDALSRAQRGQFGTLITEDYLGNRTLQAYGPVNLPGLNWSLIAKINTDEAFTPVLNFTRKLVWSTVLIIFLVCIASMFLARLFVRPIKRLEAGAERIGAGNFDTTLPVLSRDEFGDLTMVFNEMSRGLKTHQDLLAEQQRENRRLLLSLMPEAVADRHRGGEDTVAEDHRDVSVIFADIVGLDELATQLPAEELLRVVNHIVRQFDAAAEELGVERVRTMRSGYLASCGLNTPWLDNVRRTVDFAVEIDSIIERFNNETGHHLALRIGIDTGTVTTGLVGRTTVVYDMWGAAVNLAHRAQSGPAEPGIYVSTAVYDAMRDVRQFAPAGEVAVAGAPGAATEQIWKLVEPPA